MKITAPVPIYELTVTYEELLMIREGLSWIVNNDNDLEYTAVQLAACNEMLGDIAPVTLK